MFHGGTLNDLRFWDEIFDSFMYSYVSTIGNDFFLMDDNTQPHRAAVVEVYLRVTVRSEWNGQLNL